MATKDRKSNDKLSIAKQIIPISTQC